ncbi:hypothetical protein DNTS_013080 [Danionella cerebrum]|uniref:RUN domain-containing protein n=1 Tax=Danionella cerebrum TaxID=2873325 RepID=A0A553QVB2_9TELE|nr:hypothetical protein DNTS_013080 [Danionella translucida]
MLLSLKADTQESKLTEEESRRCIALDCTHSTLAGVILDRGQPQAARASASIAALITAIDQFVKSALSVRSIEVCLSHLLKRRAAGFLRSDKIAALFTKIGKVNTTASDICRRVQEQLQQQAEITRIDSLIFALCIAAEIPDSNQCQTGDQVVSVESLTLT